jgi:regulator of replication initiation timing
MTQDKIAADDRVESLQEENERLGKELAFVQDTLKFENASIKVETKRMKTDNAEFKRQNSELFDDNVRLTLEVNRLSDQLEYALKQLDEMEGHASVMKEIAVKMTTLGNNAGGGKKQKP